MLTPSEIRGHIETDLGDNELQRLIDAETEAIEKHAGGTGMVTDHLEAFGQRRISLMRDASSIDQVRVRVHPDYDEETLGADDYRFHPPRTLVRLSGSAEPGTTWRGHVEVDYTPVADDSLRETVLIHLVQLSLEYRGLDSEAVGGGDRSVTLPDYEKERHRILSRLDGRKATIA